MIEWVYWNSYNILNNGKTNLLKERTEAKNG